MARKRLNDEGSITYHKKWGLWYGRISHEGKRIGVYRKSQADLKKALMELQLKQHQGVQIVNSSMALKEYLLKNWLPAVENKSKTQTYLNYRSVTLNHLIPRLGHIKLKDIRSSSITRAWNTMINDGHSAHVVQSCQRRLSAALTSARKEMLIQVNPCADASVPRIEDREMRTLSSAQRARVLAYIKDHPIYQEYYWATHTALHTGMRRNELLALRWSDIDAYLMTATVNRSMYVGKGGEISFPTPKTQSGRRTLSLTVETCMELNKYRDIKGEIKEGDLIFNRLDTGNPILPDTLSHAWIKVVRLLNAILEKEREEKKSDIPHIEARFHDLRHTHATVMFKANINDKIIQQRLGHKRNQTTKDIYMHVLPSMERDAVEKLSEALTSVD